jgi:hypothetical protein
MQRMKISMSGDPVDDSISFLVDLRDGHRYTVSPDPCCFVVVYDLDDALIEAAKCGTASGCPAGSVEVDKLVYRNDDCGKQPTCAAPAMVRGLRYGLAPTTISIDDSDPVNLTYDYQAATAGREAPHHIVVKYKGRAVFDERVILRYGVHYTIGPGEITVDD